MSPGIRRVLFLMFFLSGFCGLVYQVVWMRLAVAAFGVITPVLSIVISVFMLGLSIGSWAGGRFIDSLVQRTAWSAAVFYGLAEFVIGLGAFAVPKLFGTGESLLLTAGQTDSFAYLAFSGLVLAISILPWCVLMGATFPFMMAFVRERDSRNAESFSFLYLANVLGAMSGTFLTAMLLIELLGFRRTLWVAAACNFTVGLIGLWLGCQQRGLAAAASASAERRPEPQPANPSSARVRGSRLIQWILFSTGFSAMAMEVVWTRAFTPVLKTQVYSFALIVFAYLGATFLGSWWYRRDLKRNSTWATASLMSLLVITVFFPILAEDARLVKMEWSAAVDAPSAAIVLASICPFCAVLGYLTPRLIDEYAGGRPAVRGQGVEPYWAGNVPSRKIGPPEMPVASMGLSSQDPGTARIRRPRAWRPAGALSVFEALAYMASWRIVP
ncbi:membrane hypothetical protein [Verrucomicrobia bacterium]|nr:membrane hypothetical protein [Verrucomicrobiota bacterium]